MKYLISLILVVSVLSLNSRPLIGVLTVPSELDDYNPENYSTLDGSYIKYIESAGAIPVPIQWDSNYTELSYLFEHLNGILFTGGDTLLYLNDTQPGFTFNKFTDTVSFLLSKAIQSNADGKTYPMFGICQGFQVMNYVMSNYFPVLQPVQDNLQKQRLLKITKKDSYMFASMPSTIQHYISTITGPFEYNHWAVFKSTYDKVPQLNSFFDIVAYSYDGDNNEYVAAVEAKNYPFYSFQFHPEKHQFEFNSPASHTKEMVKYGQHLINQFVAKAKENSNTLPDDILFKKAIYSYNSTIVNLDDQTTAYIFTREEPVSDDLYLGIRKLKTIILKGQY